MAILACVLLGAAVGSFLNVVIDRVPRGQSLLSPGSHCPECDRELGPAEMVPILSYLALRGRCRTCGAVIPWRILVVELLTAALFGALCWQSGVSWALLLRLVYAAFLVAILFIDLEHQLILDVMIYPAIGVAVLFVPIWALLLDPPYAQWSLTEPLLYLWLGPWVNVAFASLVGQLLGGLVGAAVFGLIYWLARNGMGQADIRLAAFVGLITAFPGIIAASAMSFVFGGIVAVTLLALKRVGRKTAIPFAPFLVIAAFIMMFFGDGILRAYLG